MTSLHEAKFPFVISFHPNINSSALCKPYIEYRADPPADVWHFCSTHPKWSDTPPDVLWSTSRRRLSSFAECVMLMFGVTTPKNFKISASDEALSNLLITTRFRLIAGLDWRFLRKLSLNFPLAFFAHPSLLSRRSTSRPTEIL